MASLESIPRPVRIGLAVVFGLAFILFAGSYLYWVGEGRPGTPEDFRGRVADAGLDVEWTNNGPRAGDGFITDDCGRPVAVTVDERDGELWVRSDKGGREPLTAGTLDRLRDC
ncbi:MAG: hypothetical protein HKN24_12935 [Acidimicrobiales bacterium]|nr:hypothetical protein [Acidimicrobiales bacterium]